ncbi:MAG: murein biosynthesis integral membrane protein MurJ, partial [Pseudomonadota bacterium]
QAAMPWFVWALASGFEPGDERTELAVAFSRICFPYIIFISLAALFSGILNAFGRFATAAAAPVLLNVILISAMAGADFAALDIGWALASAVFAGGVAQLILVARAASQLGMTLRIKRPRLTPDIRRLVALGVPAALSGGVMQINLLVGTQIASWTDGAIVWLWMADRVYQLPLGLVGVAIGIVLLPDLSRRVQAGDFNGAAGSMNRAAEFALALTLPATAALLVIPELITSALFERGAYDAEDISKTAMALWIYALGLPAFVLQRVLQPAFMAREDMKTPLRYAVISMLVNVVLALALLPVLGWLGTAVGTTVAGWTMVGLLWQGGKRLSSTIRVDDRLALRGGRMLAASVIMGAVVFGLAHLLDTLPAWFALALIVPAGGVCYTLLASLLGAFQPGELRAAFRKGG